MKTNRVNKSLFLCNPVTTMILVASLIVTPILISGCAAVMAAKQPGYTDMNVLRLGTTRSEIIAVFGPPILSETDKDGNLVEHYQFNQGYRKGTKIVRVMFHIAADFFTLFLWEFVGMPIEVAFDGKRTTVTTTFDENKLLQNSTVTDK